MKEISCLCGKWKWRPDKFPPPFRICSRTEWQCCFPPGGHSIYKWELGERWKTLHFKFCWQFLELKNFCRSTFLPNIVAINPLFVFLKCMLFLHHLPLLVFRIKVELVHGVHVMIETQVWKHILGKKKEERSPWDIYDPRSLIRIFTDLVPMGCPRPKLQFTALWVMGPLPQINLEMNPII